MHNYTIGVDTGGTFTDAVLFDTDRGIIIATEKTPTTHGQLERGISLAIEELITKARVGKEQLGKIAVSSTLATNAVVEGKGARVALIVIGYVKSFTLPVRALYYLNGGHTVQGLEEQPLDVESLVDLIESVKTEIDAYAVCSAMSMKNPSHELVVEKAIAMLDPKPVFCSHRISDLAGMQERAATVALHASLMPVMSDYVDALERAVKRMGLSCPVEIITGNARSIQAERAVSEAGLTVASGPACTAVFGAHHADKQTAVVIDVGGTTTDIALIEDGRPILAATGCQIGSWTTQLEAVDMTTMGIGGDSLVEVIGIDDIQIGPTRAIPLAMSAHAISPASWLGPEANARLILANREKVRPESGEIEATIFAQGPLTPAALRATTGMSRVPLQGILERLAKDERIIMSGFTPTDALHVLDKLKLGDQKKAVEGAETLGKGLGLDAVTFSRLILEKTQAAIEVRLLEFLVARFWQIAPGGLLARRQEHSALTLDFSLKIPIIGLGAASAMVLPGIAERLGAPLVLPENYQVGNGAGAALAAMGHL
jgi:N-methylhydantoinase A/oxoprolinase/acetone carboxylase beta subunit